MYSPSPEAGQTAFLGRIEAARRERRGLLHDLLFRDALEQIGRVQDGAQRIAQIVPEHSVC